MSKEHTKTHKQRLRIPLCCLHLLWFDDNDCLLTEKTPRQQQLRVLVYAFGSLVMHSAPGSRVCLLAYVANSINVALWRGVHCCMQIVELRLYGALPQGLEEDRRTPLALGMILLCCRELERRTLCCRRPQLIEGIFLSQGTRPYDIHAQYTQKVQIQSLFSWVIYNLHKTSKMLFICWI